MKTFGNGPDKLREALRQAYLSKEPPQTGDRWRRTLMARVREIGPLNGKPLFLPSFEKVVWRLVPVTTSVALILIIFLMKLGLTPGYDTLQTFLNGIDYWTISQLFPV